MKNITKSILFAAVVILSLSSGFALADESEETAKAGTINIDADNSSITINVTLVALAF